MTSMAADVLRLLTVKGETLAVAESLTGGLVAAELAAVPGASKAFRGSVTAYATDLKRDVLGVDAALLDRRGAVDPQVAAQMAAGVRKVLGADWGIATTGVAGPEPQDGQPVGTVFVAVDGPSGASGRGRCWRESDGVAVERLPDGNPYGECTERAHSASGAACGRTHWERAGTGYGTERGVLMFAALSEHDIAPRTAAAQGGTVGREGCGYAVRGGSHR